MKQRYAADEGRAVLIFGGTFLILGLALVASVFAAWPNNVLKDQSASTAFSQLSLFAPQGWEFFTRDPESPGIVALKQGPGGTWVRAETLPQSSPSNLLGLSRNQRAQDTEKAILIAEATQWIKCDGYIDDCMSQPQGQQETLENKTSNKYFCGPLRLVETRPVAFSFRETALGHSRVSRYVEANVKC